MEFIAEIIFEFFCEVLLQLFFELLVDLGAVKSKKRGLNQKERNPALSFLGYTIIGAALGGGSVWLFPDLFIRNGTLSIFNLALSPIVAGFLMSLIGYWRRKHSKELVRLDSFLFGYGFAFAFTLVRFLLAN